MHIIRVVSEREKVIRREKEYCEFVLIIGKGFPEYWGRLRGVVRLKSRRLGWKAKESKFCEGIRIYQFEFSKESR